MTMTEDEKNLDEMFATARENRPLLSDDLTVRILTDAEQVRLNQIKAADRPRRSYWARVLDGIGGWHSFGGLVAASAAGVWIGFAAPDFLPDPATYIYQQEAGLALADLDTSFLEGAE
ncbi:MULTISPECIES: hypothetical protein [Ruegeria]|jgi:hypothetical protein|uniref:hypothetical protein n=2 Tax=Roseobacteraceae TaxID=2854170 RepID=UPI001F35C313|nr:hypothetical protein [Ruegeria lacuscaerulensis]